MLEQRLFDRHARGMRPTPACQDLLPVARQVLLGLSAGADAVAARQQRGHSVVRIAASLAATHGLLVDTLPAFTRRVPTVTVQLTEAEGDDQLLAITRGEVDLVACRRPQVIPEAWQFLPLLQDRFAVVCRRTHPMATRKTVKWADLASQVWIVAPAGVASRQSFDALSTSLPEAPRTYPIITRSPAMVRWLLRNENVLAYLPFNYVRPLIEAGELAEIKVRPRVDIEALGLLRPREGLSEAAERLWQPIWSSGFRPPRRRMRPAALRRGARLDDWSNSRTQPYGPPVERKRRVSRMRAAPSSVAAVSFSAPPRVPIGVLTGVQRTMSGLVMSAPSMQAHAGICNCLRRLLSNADAGTKRLSRLTVFAVRPAVYRRRGFAAVAAMTTVSATTSGESAVVITARNTASAFARAGA
jgi:DNA-binding transcriptional LysR family regulator